MTEEERAELLTRLESLLAELGLDFVVAQERLLAAEGISRAPTGEVAANRDESHYAGSEWTEPVSYPAEEATELPPVVSRQPRLRKGDVVVRPLNVSERLAVLLDLVEVTTAGTVAMEQETRRLFREVQADGDEEWVHTWDGSVVFADPPEAALRGFARNPWTLGTRLPGNASAARKVVHTLERLRGLAGLSRGAWLESRNQSTSGTTEIWNLDREEGSS